MYQLWTTMQAKRIEPSDVAWRWTGIGERKQGPTSKPTRWLQIVTYDIQPLQWLARERPREKKMTHQILVQTHTKSTLRPSQIWTRCSTVRYRETLDASPKMGSLWLSVLGHYRAFISNVSPHDLVAYSDAIWGLVWFVVIIVLTWERWESCFSFGAVAWNRHRLIQII